MAKPKKGRGKGRGTATNKESRSEVWTEDEWRLSSFQQIWVLFCCADWNTLKYFALCLSLEAKSTTEAQQYPLRFSVSNLLRAFCIQLWIWCRSIKLYLWSCMKFCHEHWGYLADQIIQALKFTYSTGCQPQANPRCDNWSLHESCPPLGITLWGSLCRSDDCQYRRYQAEGSFRGKARASCQRYAAEKESIVLLPSHQLTSLIHITH